LNILGWFYSTGSGFSKDNDEKELKDKLYLAGYQDALEEDKPDNDELTVYMKNFLNTLQMENIKIFKDVQTYNEWSDAWEKITVYDIAEMADVKVPYQTVVIKYRRDTWQGYPKEWYNKRRLRRYTLGEIKKGLNKEKYEDDEDDLPFLNTRKYIKVVYPFMRVEVSAVQKGKALTVDDILFATRALAWDATRSYFRFTILDSDKETLTLEPYMDNWST
jgi:hypothetical protein